MEKEKLIQTIQGLYPADSHFTDTGEVGQGLLLKAIFTNWKHLPIEILKTYAELCIQEENR